MRLYLLLAGLFIASLLVFSAAALGSPVTEVHTVRVFSWPPARGKIVKPPISRPISTSETLAGDYVRSGYVDINAHKGDRVTVVLEVDGAEADVTTTATRDNSGHVRFTYTYLLEHLKWTVTVTFRYAGHTGSLEAGFPGYSRPKAGTETLTVAPTGGGGHSLPASDSDSYSYTASANDTRLYYNATIHVERIHARNTLTATNGTVMIDADTTMSVYLTVRVEHQGGGGGGGGGGGSGRVSEVVVRSNVDGLVAGSGGVNILVWGIDIEGGEYWAVTPYVRRRSDGYYLRKLVWAPWSVTLRNGSTAYLERIDYYYPFHRTGWYWSCSDTYVGSYRPGLDESSAYRGLQGFELPPDTGNTTQLYAPAEPANLCTPSLGGRPGYTLDENYFQSPMKATAILVYTTRRPSTVRVETNIDPYHTRINGSTRPTPATLRLFAATLTLDADPAEERSLPVARHAGHIYYKGGGGHYLAAPTAVVLR